VIAPIGAGATLARKLRLGAPGGCP
jgi:hypothetical protein